MELSVEIIMLAAIACASIWLALIENFIVSASLPINRAFVVRTACMYRTSLVRIAYGLHNLSQLVHLNSLVFVSGPQLAHFLDAATLPSAFLIFICLYVLPGHYMALKAYESSTRLWSTSPSALLFGLSDHIFVYFTGLSFSSSRNIPSLLLIHLNSLVFISQFKSLIHSYPILPSSIQPLWPLTGPYRFFDLRLDFIPPWSLNISYRLPDFYFVCSVSPTLNLQPSWFLPGP